MQNKLKKRGLSALLIVAMLVMLLPVSVYAGKKDYRLKVLKAGKWAAKSYNYNYDTVIHYTYYKISVSKPGRLNFTLSSEGSLSLYTSLSDIVNSTSKASRTYLNPYSESRMIAVEKGTYYLYVSDGKVKYTFSAEATPTNYCVAKAKALKANVAAYSVFTPKTNFSRWYKITNPKKKKIVYWTSTVDSAYSVAVYNTKMRRLATVKNGSDLKYCTKAAQPKGTYYIYVREQYRSPGESNYAFGDVVSLKWK